MDIRSLFEKKRKYLEYFFENIDIEKTQSILQILLNCKNNIIFTGLGKSGFIANKIAMTMLSTGTKAIYLPVTDALHGDIGIVSQDDVFVVISKSGQTDELLEIIPYIKKRHAKVIAVVSNKKSEMIKIADEFIYLPVLKELCPYNLAPTTSTAVQLIFGDVLTVALMQKKNFSLKDYAINHPKGAIGKQITLKVEDLMKKEEDLPICKEEDLIKDVLHLLSTKNCGCLIAIDNNKAIKGIFTDGDLRRVIEKEGSGFLSIKIKDVMTKSPKVIIKDLLAIDAMKEMEEQKQITVIPVVENNKLIGLIRMHDIIQAGLSSLSL